MTQSLSHSVKSWPRPDAEALLLFRSVIRKTNSSVCVGFPGDKRDSGSGNLAVPGLQEAQDGAT